MSPKVSGIVLAGGRSTRLGIDKSLIAFDGIPLIARGGRKNPFGGSGVHRRNQ